MGLTGGLGVPGRTDLRLGVRGQCGLRLRGAGLCCLMGGLLGGGRLPGRRGVLERGLLGGEPRGLCLVRGLLGGQPRLVRLPGQLRLLGR